jgi:hypothetical protein
VETILNIPVGREGVGKITTSIESIADGVNTGHLLATLALPISLLDATARERFKGEASESAEPAVFLPRNVDGEFDENRKIRVQSADCPRDPFDGVPTWFLAGVKKLFPGENWDELLLPLTREQLVANHSEEWIAAHKDLTVDQLNEISMAPYCNLQEEWAVSLFESAAHGYLDHWGWLEKADGRDVLVSEPYGVSGKDLRTLIETLDKVGWDLNVRGVSGHYPSATLRIEIAPQGV